MLPASHAPSLSCSLPLMLPASHAPSLSCSLPLMLPASHAPCLSCSLPLMLPASHALCLSCSLPLMLPASRSQVSCSLPLAPKSPLFLFFSLHSVDTRHSSPIFQAPGYEASVQFAVRNLISDLHEFVIGHRPPYNPCHVISAPRPSLLFGVLPLPYTLNANQRTKTRKAWE